MDEVVSSTKEALGVEEVVEGGIRHAGGGGSNGGREGGRAREKSAHEPRPTRDANLCISPGRSGAWSTANGAGMRHRARRDERWIAHEHVSQRRLVVVDKASDRNKDPSEGMRKAEDRLSSKERGEGTHVALEFYATPGGHCDEPEESEPAYSRASIRTCAEEKKRRTAGKYVHAVVLAHHKVTDAAGPVTSRPLARIGCCVRVPGNILGR
ncbi:hypothetical protein FB451DRAFT_1477692 [Mycena latifolia]|nr:hypothetical protein FB451DRAFT_1477692 [Mycena latifolia]